MLFLWLLACGSTEPATLAPTPAPPAEIDARGAATTATAAREIGTYPLCEPSTLLPLDDGAFLLADNEGRPADDKKGEQARATLWVVPASGEPVAVGRDEAAQDVESLVRLDDELWVMGSLSRNKDCEVKAKRWEIHVHPVEAWTAAGLSRLGPARVVERKKKDIAEIEGSVAGCRTVLFRGSDEGVPLCEAIVRSAASPAGRACDALNVEGAVNVGGRVWLGLRAPLVDGKAVLARLVDSHDALSFDAVRLVDLGGLGVRELAVDGDRLVGIAGTVLDSDGDDRSRMFSTPLAGLETGELPVTVHDADLPPTAEGLRLGAAEVTYVLDGAAGDSQVSCEDPARIMSRPR